MEPVVLLHKPVGMTPLEAVRRLQAQQPELISKKLGYAGRLDPMAEGLLLLLIGEENKKRKSYERLPKTYEFEILCGFETDSYDLLGKVVKTKRVDNSGLKAKLEHIMSSLIGVQMQSYPPYSAVRVRGHSIFWWAKHNRLSEIHIPSKQIEIYECHLREERTIHSHQLLKDIKEKIGKVRGDFRQEEIIALWESNLCDEYVIPMYRLSISCSSGTYIRCIAHEIGKQLNIPCLAASISRVRIGNYSLSSALSLV